MRMGTIACFVNRTATKMFLRVLLLCAVLYCTIDIGHAATDKVICYFASWAIYRSSNGAFKPETIDPNLCTHIYYAFLGVNADGTLKLLDSWSEVDLGGLEKVAALKQRNPKVKTILSIGGYNQGHPLLATVITSGTLRQRFAESCIDYFERYGYDGLDIVWEYPTTADKSFFALLLLELKQKFANKYEISIAVPGNIIEGAYDGPAISSAVNYVHILSFDYHGAYDGVTGHNSPLYGDPNVDDDKLNIDSSVKNWIELGVSPSKITIGLSLYGHTYTLANASDIRLGAPTSAPGISGPYTQSPGLLGYNEICELYQDWTRHWDATSMVPYKVAADQWLSYDDETSISEKVKYARKNGLAGLMVYSIDTDDFLGYCGKVDGLLQVIQANL